MEGRSESGLQHPSVNRSAAPTLTIPARPVLRFVSGQLLGADRCADTLSATTSGTGSRTNCPDPAGEQLDAGDIEPSLCALSMVASKSLARRRLRLSHAIVRSTIHRCGNGSKPLAVSDRLTMSTDARLPPPRLRLCIDFYQNYHYNPVHARWTQRGRWSV